MATEYLFSNNATTTLAQSVSATATVLNVASGDGNLFPSPTSGQAFAVTLVDAATGLTNEICYCTSRSGDQLTVVRGREGTNAIAWAAGDTCANYITADVMERWLQESDLDGYLTGTQSDARYVRSPAVPDTDYRVIAISRNKSNGGIWVIAEDNSNTQLQPAGDYATNPALNTETTNRTNADTNLQNQINNRVLKTGDTMTGGLTIKGGAGYATDFSPSNPSQGSYVNYPGYASIGSARGVSFGFSAQEHVGTETLGLFTLSGTAVGSPVYWYMHQSGRLGDSIGGNYAYTTEVDKKQDAGDYAVNSDLPLPRGMHQQIFTVNIPSNNGSGGFLVSLPTAFSNFSFCTSCDTGSNVYLTSALPENAGQARIFAKFANGTWATSGLLTITASGYYS